VSAARQPLGLINDRSTRKIEAGKAGAEPDDSHALRWSGDHPAGLGWVRAPPEGAGAACQVSRHVPTRIRRRRPACAGVCSHSRQTPSRFFTRARPTRWFVRAWEAAGDTATRDGSDAIGRCFLRARHRARHPAGQAGTIFRAFEQEAHIDNAPGFGGTGLGLTIRRGWWPHGLDGIALGQRAGRGAMYFASSHASASDPAEPTDAQPPVQSPEPAAGSSWTTTPPTPHPPEVVCRGWQMEQSVAAMRRMDAPTNRAANRPAYAGAARTPADGGTV